MNKSNNRTYYEDMWEEATFKPSFALVDDTTIKAAKQGYDFGCSIGENLAKQKVDNYILTQKKINEKSIKRNNILVAGGVALTIASGTVTILEPSFSGLATTLTTAAITTIAAFNIKEKKYDLEELLSLSDNVSNDHTHDFNIKKHRFLKYNFYDEYID